jgi:uncharacterized protein (TIGR02118 family)
MIRVSVFYPNTPGSHFDVDYYVAHHRPLSLELLAPAIRGFGIDRGVCAGPPGTLPAYHAIGHLLFDSAESFYTVFAAAASSLGQHVVNFTNVEPVVQISEIVHSE